MLERANCLVRLLPLFLANTGITPFTEQGINGIDSNVVLEGSVDSFWKKVYAEALADGASGVIKVTNSLMVVATKKVVDETIAKDVTEALRRNATVDADSVGVTVENGVVTVTGTVVNWGAKTAAFFAALCTRGVVHVDDRLTVKRL
jgi:osmotically-inducible protein OsmY